ncbi:MAG TPA: hypothetical protein VKP03_03195 [Patescibacteria group bacterium]|nr:hypothetical protein [Patescibacteria group bacterium]
MDRRGRFEELRKEIELLNKFFLDGSVTDKQLFAKREEVRNSFHQFYQECHPSNSEPQFSNFFYEGVRELEQMCQEPLLAIQLKFVLRNYSNK